MDNAEILDSVFNKFLSGKELFKAREVLRHDYIPESLPHREEQIKHIGEMVTPILKGSRCSNIFIYGKTGTGKTAVVKYVLNKLAKKAAEFGSPMKMCYVNCRLAGTEYRVFSSLCEILEIGIPFTGLALGEVFDRFRNGLETRKLILVAVLDEIDALVKDKGDKLLYELTRINEALKGSKTTIIGISNDLRFKEFLDPRVLSSLSEEETVFRPYDAHELQDILFERAKVAFHRDVVSDGSICLCAALAAAEHGDARRALDLLRVAGELVEREGAKTLTEDHIRQAEKRMEHDRVVETMRNLPTHSKLVLCSVYLLGKRGVQQIVTGEIYEVYCEISRQVGTTPLTQRRVSSLINELDSLGLVNAQLVNMGRYGRTKKIRLNITQSQCFSLFDNDTHLKSLTNCPPRRLTEYAQ